MGRRYWKFKWPLIPFLLGWEYNNASVCRFVKNDTIIYNSNYYRCNYLTSDISKEETIQIDAYPNPSTGIIYIKAESLYGVLSIVVRNTMGQELINSQQSSLQAIDISNYPSGIYFITIKDNEGKYGIKKVIKE